MDTKKYITVSLHQCMLEIFHHKKLLKINCIFESKQSNCAVPMTEQRSPWLLRSFVPMACGRQKNALQRHARPNCGRLQVCEPARGLQETQTAPGGQSAEKWRPWPYNCKELKSSSIGNEQENRFSLSASPERNPVGWYLDFSLVRPRSHFRPTEPEDHKWVFFETANCVIIWYGRNGK